jgi:hypothetical protein
MTKVRRLRRSAPSVGRRTLPMPSCGAAIYLLRASGPPARFLPTGPSHALIRRRRSLPARAHKRFRLVGPPQREARAAAAEQMIAHVAQLNAAYATRAITGVRRPICATKQGKNGAARQRQSAAHSRANGCGHRTGRCCAAVLRRRAACGGHRAMGMGYRETTRALLSPACPCALQRRFEEVAWRSARKQASAARICSRRRVCARRHAQERVRIFSYAFGVDAVFSDVQVGCKRTQRCGRDAT